jgi:hypothetical protein
VGETRDGRAIWDSPDAAARAAGGLYAVEEQPFGWRRNGEHEYKLTRRFTIIWDEDGTRGGAGGGIQEWVDFDGRREFYADYGDGIGYLYTDVIGYV